MLSTKRTPGVLSAITALIPKPPEISEYIDVQNENYSFEVMALAQSRNFVLTGRDQPVRIGGMRTQSSLLEMLGEKPRLGRLLLWKTIDLAKRM